MVSPCWRTTASSMWRMSSGAPGSRPSSHWIDLPVFGEDGQPLHERGVVESEPGLYFLGLVFLYSFSSDVLPNRGRDAEYIAKHIGASDPKETRSPAGGALAGVTL